MAWEGVSLETGGSTPNASQVSLALKASCWYDNICNVGDFKQSHNHELEQIRDMTQHETALPWSGNIL